MGTASATRRAGIASTREKAKQAKSAVAEKVATVTVGELRSSFKAVEAKLAKGVRVQVTRRGEVVAEMKAPAKEAGVEAADPKVRFIDRLPAMQARLHELWGGPQDVDTTAMVSEGRDRDFLS